MNLNHVELARALSPEAALTLGALLVLGIDLIFFKRAQPSVRLRSASLTAAAAIVTAFVFSFCNHASPTALESVLALDKLAVATRCGALGLSFLVLGITSLAPTPRHSAEYIALLLFATAGITLMAVAQHLLVAFLALELTSLSLYALVAFDTHRREATEAALKYFLFGGVSAAFLLFSFSLLYGLTGAVDLRGVAHALAHQNGSPLLALALVMMLVAFGYKTAAAPFHLWAPDAYQGAPTPIAALIASGSKLGGLIMFSRLLWPSLLTGTAANDSAHSGLAWLSTLALLSAASLVLGNIAALAQSNIRRLLAYSAIAHAGSLLLGVMIAGPAGAGPLYYYALTYGIATAGAFGVIAAVERNASCQQISDLAGLSRRSPLLAGCLLVFILSLAGIPPLAGFFGKFFVFSAALKVGGLAAWEGQLALAAILLSVVSLYYYLLVLKQAWITPVADNAAGQIRVSPVGAIALVLAASAIVLLGVFPNYLLGGV